MAGMGGGADEISLKELLSNLKDKYPEFNKYSTYADLINLLAKRNSQQFFYNHVTCESKSISDSIVRNFEKALFEFKEIPNYAFAGLDFIENFTIPYTIERIGVSAFIGASQLSKVTIPNNVMYIDRTAFGGTAIKEITLPTNLIELDRSVFFNCKELTSLKIADNSISKIPMFLCCGCEKLSNVELGNSVKIIGWSAFKDCVRLKSIKIPDSVETIEMQAFYNCKNLQNIEFPESLKLISNDAFTCCRKLKSVRISKDTGLEGYPFPVSCEVIRY